MIPSFDIFQTESDGNVLWRETAATIEEAKARVQELAVKSPGEYFIFSLKTGNKVVVHTGGSSGFEEQNLRVAS